MRICSDEVGIAAHQIATVIMKFNPEDVRRMQANRMVAEAKRILSSSQELSRIQYADITSMLQKVDLKDLNSDGLILLQDCRKLVIKREKRVELSKSTVPAAEEESGPALSATPKSIVTTKPSIQADAAPSSSANSDVEETTSGERIHALLQARKVRSAIGTALTRLIL